MELNAITGSIISAAMKVHTAMGPGLLESVYQTYLQHELEKSGMKVHREVAIPVTYDGLKLDAKFRYARGRPGNRGTKMRRRIVANPQGPNSDLCSSG